MPVSIRFKGVVGTTAQLESDKFAGRIGFNTTLARYVVYFDATNYATMARRDVLETFAAGIQDSTLTAGLPMYAGTSGRHYTESVALFRTRIDVAKASDKLNRIPATITGQNANSFVTSGVWVGANVVNAPNTAWGVLRVFRNGDDAGDQVWQEWRSASYSGAKIYRRGSADFGATWGPWVGIVSDGGAASLTTLETTGLATLAQAQVNGDVNTSAAYKTAGIERISAGGAGTLTTLQTTGLATLAQATVQDLTPSAPVYASTGGRLATESGPSFRSRIGADSRVPTVITGQNADAFNTSGVFVGANVTNAPNPAWGTLRVHRNGDDAGDQVWQTWTEARYQGGKIYVRGSADFGVTWDPWVSAIYNGGAASVTTLQTTGLATLAQATVSDLTTGRMVSTTTAGRLQALDAAGSRSLIGLGSSDSVTFQDITFNGNIVAGGLNSIVSSHSYRYQQSLSFSGNQNTNSSYGLYTYTGTGGHTFSIFSPTLARKILVVNNAGTGPLLFDQTINGGSFTLPVGATATITSDGSGWFAVLGGVDGNAFNQYTAVTQTGIVTQQSLASTGAGSRTIGAGRLNSLGAGMELYLCGTYTTDAAPGNATIRVRIGSTIFRTIGSFVLDSSITGGIWWIRGRITTRTTGATGTVGGQLMWEHQGSSTAGSEVMHVQPSTSTADVTVDLTASQTIDVDWTATNAGTSITCTCFSINLIR